MVRVVIQRVSQACTLVNGKGAASIGKGLLVLVGFTAGDSTEHVEWMCQKLLKIRLWEDAKGRSWSTNVTENNFELLIVSQPEYPAVFGKDGGQNLATRCTDAKDLFNNLVDICAGDYTHVKAMAFDVPVHIDFINDGPVTMELDSAEAKSLKVSKPKKTTRAKLRRSS